MEYKSVWYRRVEYLSLVFAVILQLVALASPGWRIVVHGNSEEYLGIFYQTQCIRDTCETRSLHDIYHDMVSETGSRATQLRTDEEYHRMIKQQVYMTVILVITIVTTIVQYYKLKHKEIHFPRLTTVSLPPTALACGLMISIIVDEFLWIDDMLELTNVDHRDNRYIGFPYCLATYIAAFVAMMIVNCLFVAEICKAVQKAPTPPPKKALEYDYEAPVSIIPVTNENFASNSIDNKICDVRL